MKPITNMYSCVGITAAILLICSFLASKMPVSAAADSGMRSTNDTNEPIAERTTSGLVVDIDNVRNGDGKIVVFVFDDKRAFEEYEYERAVKYTEIVADAGNVQAHFPELPTGSYAVAIFHDENDDDDFNMLGLIPLEGYGTSGARNWYHEPTFDEASSDAGRVFVRMYYP